MLWPRFLRRTGTRPKFRDSNAPSVRPWVEELEVRNLPSVTAMLAAGALTVTGTGNDAIEVSLANGGTALKVIGDGRNLGTFAPVTSITVNTGAGTNVVRIDANVTQTATITASGTGNNTFYGGAGTTFLNGGAGQNRLVAGSGVTTLTAGTGINQLVGGAGGDVFVVPPGSGTTLDYNVKATDHETNTPTKTVANAPPPTVVQNLTTNDVSILLQRAAAATPSDDGIVAVVDRAGNILGVRVEAGVPPAITGNMEKLIFAIDGAVAEVRTAALFSNNQAPLTSRTIQDLSESTITQQEVQSDPNDPNTLLQGPGFVAPVEIGAHFPANIPSTPQVDLFDIQSGNRDSLNFDGVPLALPARFDVGGHGKNNLDPNANNQNFAAPESYGVVSGLEPLATVRGIGTLPGGVPIFKSGQLVGGIGVFFPGTTGYASAENSSLSSTYNPALPDRSLEAEFIAFFAAGGVPGVTNFGGAVGNAPALPANENIALPNGRIDLAGITLDIYGPGGQQGIGNTVHEGLRLGIGKGNANSGANQVLGGGNFLVAGVQPAAGYIADPVNGDPNATGQFLTASDVTTIVNQVLAQAAVTQAAIRTPAGQPAQFVIAITDLDGNVIGLYREGDATVFSESVAVAKARNVAYYADPAELQAIDQIPGIPAGVAFTSRTFRYLADPRYPEGIDGAPPGPFSILQDGDVSNTTGLETGPRKTPAQYTSVQGHNDFNADSNFHQLTTAANFGNMNGIVFFPGGVPLYKNGILVGGLGISGDGVNQDDVVTAFAAAGFNPPANLRVDNYSYQGVRLPYQKFGRNPEGN